MTLTAERGRATLLWGLLALAALAATGAVADKGFSEPSTAKYLVTLAGPLILLFFATTARPLEVFAVALLAFAPFGLLVITVSGVEIQVLETALLLGLVLVLTTGDVAVEPSPMLWPALCALALFAAPLIAGADLHIWFGVLAALAGSGLVVSRVARTRRGARIVMAAILTGGAIQAFVALYETKTGVSIDFYGNGRGLMAFGDDYFFGFEEFNRAHGIFDPISLGNVLAISLPLGLAFAASATDRREALGAAALSIVVMVGLALTLARMSWIGASLGLLVAFTLMPARGRARIAPGMLLVLAAGALAIGVSGASGIGDRVSSISHPLQAHYTGRGDRLRVRLWHEAVAIADTEPIMGTGIGRLGRNLQSRVAGAGPSTHAHSTYIQTYAEAGLLGVAGLVALLWGIASCLREAYRRAPVLAAGTAGSLVALMICWLTDYTMRYSNVAVFFAAIFGLAAGLSRMEPSGSRRESRCESGERLVVAGKDADVR